MHVPEASREVSTSHAYSDRTMRLRLAFMNFIQSLIKTIGLVYVVLLKVRNTADWWPRSILWCTVLGFLEDLHADRISGVDLSRAEASTVKTLI